MMAQGNEEPLLSYRFVVVAIMVMGVASIVHGMVLIRRQEVRDKGSESLMLAHVNWLNAILSRPTQTSLTREQVRFFGVFELVLGALILLWNVALWRRVSVTSS